MISVQGCSRSRKERISKALSKPLLLAESNYKGTISLIFDPGACSVRFFMAKYIKKNLQQIPKAVLKAWVLAFNKPRKKFMKTWSPDVYHDKSHIECYNFG